MIRRFSTKPSAKNIFLFAFFFTASLLVLQAAFISGVTTDDPQVNTGKIPTPKTVLGYEIGDDGNLT